MSLDRMNPVEIADAPKELVLSKLWKEQYTHLHLLYNSLLHRSLKAVPNPIMDLGTLDEDVPMYDKCYYRYEEHRGRETDIWDLTKMSEWPDDVFKCIKFSTVRKLAVTFNRNANPDWNYQKAENRLSDYKTLQEELGDNEHAILPDVTLPKKPAVMPFVKQASDIIQRWMQGRYNFERKFYTTKPCKLVVLLKRSPPMKRKILISVDDTPEEKVTKSPSVDWKLHGTMEVFDATDLLRDLQEVVEKYDVQSVYASLHHHVSHLEKLQCKEDEGEEEQVTLFS